MHFTAHNALHGIESANQQHLYGVFGDAQWTNKDRLPDALLKDLIEHFSALKLGNSRVSSDIIGDAYEYLIKQFADATNRKAGEFYTPRCVVRLMVDILDPQEGETVYDPACGTGGMLLAAVESVRERGGDLRTFFGKLYGQEKNLTTASVARMNLLLHGIEDFQIERADTLRNPIYSDPSTGGLATFDCVIANPPFSLKQWGREIWETEPNLFYNSPMEACVIICRSRKPAQRAGQVLFIDAVSEVTRERSVSFLRPEHQQHILGVYQTWQEEPGFARIADGERLASQEYTLSIPLYVKRSRNGNDGEPAEQRSLPALWDEWEQEGRVFWQEIDGLMEMLDGLTEM